MVSLGKEEESVERSNPLHNFKMPGLKWGTRKIMRSVKVDNSDGGVSAMAIGHREFSHTSLIGRCKDSEFDECRGSSYRRREEFRYLSSSSSPAKESLGFRRKSEVCDGGIEAVRKKLICDFQPAAVEMKNAIFGKGSRGEEQRRTVNAIFGKGSKGEEQRRTVNASSSIDDSLKPWNLRTRRAACKEPAATKVGGGGIPKPKFSPPRNEVTKSPWCLRGSSTAAPSIGKKRERAKFNRSLTRLEIEDDFLEMTGHKLPRRPKKRPKAIQKQLDMIYPELQVSEITADLYKVDDAPETGKV